jgi:hypothetical protein
MTPIDAAGCTPILTAITIANTYTGRTNADIATNPIAGLAPVMAIPRSIIGILLAITGLAANALCAGRYGNHT